MKKLMSISSGVAVEDNVNCYNAYRVEAVMVLKMKGLEFSEIKYRRNDMVKKTRWSFSKKATKS